MALTDDLAAGGGIIAVILVLLFLFLARNWGGGSGGGGSYRTASRPRHRYTRYIEDEDDEEDGGDGSDGGDGGDDDDGGDEPPDIDEAKNLEEEIKKLQDEIIKLKKEILEKKLLPVSRYFFNEKMGLGQVIDILERKITGFPDEANALRDYYKLMLIKLRGIFCEGKFYDNNGNVIKDITSVRDAFVKHVTPQYDDLLNKLKKLRAKLYRLFDLYESYLSPADLTAATAVFKNIFSSDDGLTFEIKILFNLLDLTAFYDNKILGNDIYYPSWAKGIRDKVIPGLKRFRRDGVDLGGAGKVKGKGSGGITYSNNGYGVTGGVIDLICDYINNFINKLNNYTGNSDKAYRTELFESWAQVRNIIFQFHIFLQALTFALNKALIIEEKTEDEFDKLFRFIKKLSKHYAFKVPKPKSVNDDFCILDVKKPEDLPKIISKSSELLSPLYTSESRINKLLKIFFQSFNTQEDYARVILSVLNADVKDWNTITTKIKDVIKKNTDTKCSCGENIVKIFRALRDFKGLELSKNPKQGYLWRYCKSLIERDNPYKMYLKQVFIKVVEDEHVNELITFEGDFDGAHYDFHFKISALAKYSFKDIEDLINQSLNNANKQLWFEAKLKLLGYFILASILKKSIDEIIKTTA